MNILNRKQRERFEREQLILDAAREIINTEGWAHLTMERVAAAVEYSKGTVYNHFSSKEDIVGAISCRCMSRMIGLFERAASWPGNHRERMAAIGLAHALYALLHPQEVQNMQIIKSPAIRQKISTEKQNEILQLEQRITGMVLDVIRDAMRDGDIPANEEHVPDGIFLGLWSIGYGSQLLHLSDIPFSDLGLSSPLDMLWLNSHKLLDSYHWRPLSSNMDIQALRETLLSKIFAEEIKQLNTP
jgi:AcrR family transcriptional regulator